MKERFSDVDLNLNDHKITNNPDFSVDIEPFLGDDYATVVL